MMTEPSLSLCSKAVTPSTDIGIARSVALIETVDPNFFIVAAKAAMPGSLMRVTFAAGEEPNVIWF